MAHVVLMLETASQDNIARPTWQKHLTGFAFT